MSSGTFQRHEVKFLLNRKQRMALELAMQDHMQQDQYGESTICSLYYDTRDFRLIRRSMEKPVYKEKLRLRSYGPAQQDGMVYVELKKKYDGIVYKRRISMKEAKASRYLAGETRLPEDSQIGREIDWFKKYYQELLPAVYLCYDRIAYFSREDADLRINQDQDDKSWQPEPPDLRYYTERAGNREGIDRRAALPQRQPGDQHVSV